MKTFFSFRTLVIVLVAVILCLGVAVYTGATGGDNPLSQAIGMVTSPVQKGVSKVYNAVRGSVGSFTEYEALQEENAQLRQRVAELEQVQRDAQVALEENGRLRTLLGMKERYRELTVTTAEVIARSPGSWENTISLDKGTLDGVAEGNLVTTEDNRMVGYVASVAPTYCEVTTVLDPGMQAGAMVTRSRVAGIAEGDYTLMQDGCLRLSYLDPDADVVIGDTVETSGRGGVFPKGIMLGTIERVSPEDNGISNYAVVRPFVDVNELTNVAVITSFEVVD